MIRYEEALQRILDSIEPMPIRNLAIGDLHGHALAEPVIARIDSPPFDNSAVDGFGVRLTDVATATESSPARLEVKAIIRAGDTGNQKLQAGTALKILTGALVPPTVDAVVMKEFCSENNGVVAVKQSAKPGENIRRRGGEFLRGREVLAAGRLATPPVVGLVANLGYDSFKAHVLPKAAIVTTGDELTKPGRELLPGKIYDSNAYAMESATRALGLKDVLRLHARENERDTIAIFRHALSYANVVISTGGVSVGDFDYVKAALEHLKVETHIWRIAIKPGKPVYFGIYQDASKKKKTYVFGLPGNPVSALVTYQLFVVPALAKLIGIDIATRFPILQAKLTRSLEKKAGRAEFVRARLYSNDGKLMAEPTIGQDSHMLSGLAHANGLITFPLEQEVLEAGQSVEVRFLSWNF